MPNCQNCKTDFIIAPEDFAFYERIGVPAPTLCWRCRMQRRIASRASRTLYKDQCDLCGKDTVSLYHPGSPFKVYCSPCWIGDGWDAMDPPAGFLQKYKCRPERIRNRHCAGAERSCVLPK